MNCVRMPWRGLAVICIPFAASACSLALFTDDPIDGDVASDDGGGEVETGSDADAEPDEAGDVADGDADIEPREDGDVDGVEDGDVETPAVCGNGVTEDGEECDDGNDDPGDGCEPETCRFSCHEDADCEDDSPCTTHDCAAVETGRICRSTPNPGTVCDDHDLCTHTDRCNDAGSCAGTPYDCTPGACEASSECDGNGGCTVVFAAAGASCDDGDTCTSPDTCDAAGHCSGLNTCSCPGGTNAECATHEDGNRCNGTLICVDRLCQVDPSTIVECPSDPPCAAYACDPADGSCDLSNLPAGSSCEDGQWCNGAETCDGEGTCLSGEPPCPLGGCIADCDELGSVCRPATAGTVCRHRSDVCDAAEACDGVSTGCPADASAPDGTPCDDGDPCTARDACRAGACVGGPPPAEICDGFDNDCNTEVDEVCDSVVACVDDAPCAPTGRICNENWGICVVRNCAGQPDFRPCEVVTGPDRSYDICVRGACVSPGCGDASCNAPGLPGELPDTLQISCYDNGAALATCPTSPDLVGCDSTDFCGQDAQYGWDTSHSPSARFTRFADPEPVVIDEVTELVWQGCSQGQSDPNCATGTAGTSDWSAALSYCDSLVWNGRSDWRLPSPYELQSILHHNRSASPRTSLSVFPATVPGYYWTSATNAANPSEARGIAFNTAIFTISPKTDRLAVRCVRGGSTRPSPRFARTVLDGRPVVIDAATRRMWQGCPSGMVGDASSCTGTATPGTWQAALDICQDLVWAGFDDWRLPDVIELRSIVDDTSAPSTIDPVVFPGVPADTFWASSSYPRGTDATQAWSVSFDNGRAVSASKTEARRILCVRAAP